MKLLLVMMLASSIFAACSALAAGAPLVLAQAGKSDYRIVISKDASPSERHAADELQMFLKQMGGAELPIVTDEQPMGPKEIMVGLSEHVSRLGLPLPKQASQPEGFAIRTAAPHLVIVGGRLRGTMYGVYTLLEDHLGCRWFSSKVSRIPKMERIEIGEIADAQAPALEYREPFSTDAFDADWAARNRMNSRAARLDAARGGKIQYFPFVHSFAQLIPTEKYFKDHPEWFSEVDGRRTADHTQLCLTNEEMTREAIKNVKQWIKDHPEANIISVSQNDWGNYCTCANCKALDEREGSHAATLIAFVNKIAGAIKDESPNVAIDTLAYQYTRKPPKTIKPRPNVIVRLCSIECCFSHPLATDDYHDNVSFRDDIKGWHRLTNRLYIWDYVCDFAHYIMPWPNLRVLQPNIKFFVDHGVKGIFEEGCYNTEGGDMAELKAYIMAKCLWNPNYDWRKAYDEFMEGYYGPAAPPLREYLAMLHDKVERDHLHMVIWASPSSPWLSDEILARANTLFDDAERRAAGDAGLLQRVRVARLPLIYTQLSRLAPTYALAGDTYRPASAPADLKALADEFFAVAQAANITLIREGGDNSTIDAFKQRVMREWDSYPVVALENEAVKVVIVPALGGRILSFVDKKSGQDLMFHNRPSHGRYPNVAGYEEYVGGDFEGPGATSAFEAAEQSAGGVTLKAAFPKEGFALGRRVELLSDGVGVVSTLTNTSGEPRKASLRSHPEFAPGAVEDLAVIIPGRTPGEIPLRDEGSQFIPAAEMTSHWWEVRSARGKFALRESFAPGEVSRGLVNWHPNWNDMGPRVNLELYTPERQLAPGESLRLTQTWRIVREG